jgi:hypothetical protein
MGGRRLLDLRRRVTMGEQRLARETRRIEDRAGVGVVISLATIVMLAGWEFFLCFTQLVDAVSPVGTQLLILVVSRHK